MSANYSVEADPPHSVIRITMSGFFTLADIAGFVEARRIAHARLTCGPNQHATLNDLREMKIQAQDIVTVFHAMLADPAFRSRRLAFVVGPTLARTQLMRALDNREARCFGDQVIAEAWLTSENRAAAA